MEKTNKNSGKGDITEGDIGLKWKSELKLRRREGELRQ